MDIREQVGAELGRLGELLRPPPPGNPDPVLRLLDQVTALHRAAEDARAFVATYGPDLVRHALRIGITPGLLEQRPYHPRSVARYARDVGIGPRRPGPRPARKT